MCEEREQLGYDLPRPHHKQPTLVKAVRQGESLTPEGKVSPHRLSGTGAPALSVANNKPMFRGAAADGVSRASLT